jgi:hypothetical protein
MPASQIAKVQDFDFGAPAVEDEVLKFRVRNGGKCTLRFENPEGVADGEVTVQVSDDGTTWADTTAANNVTAVANEAIVRKEWKEYVVLLRQEKDAFMRVQAVGGTRLQMQVRADAKLEIDVI